MTHKLQNQPYSTLKDGKPSYKQLEQEVKKLKEQLWTLAEDAENMLELLVNNAPIDGLWLSNIEEWDWKIKEAQEK